MAKKSEHNEKVIQNCWITLSEIYFPCLVCMFNYVFSIIQSSLLKYSSLVKNTLLSVICIQIF